MHNSEGLGPIEGAVDRSEEIVTTEGPGYATSERIVRDCKVAWSTRGQTAGGDGSERTTRPLSRV